MDSCLCKETQSEIDRKQIREALAMPGDEAGLIAYKPVSLSDKATLSPIISAQRFENSELTFPDIYIWRRSWHVEWAMVGNALYMRMRMPGEGNLPGQCLLYPVMTTGELTHEMVRLAVNDMRTRELVPMMTSVSDIYLERLNKVCPGEFSVMELRDFYDYMYSADDLRSLAGKRYHGKRNHVTQFVNQYGGEASYRALTPDDKCACLSLWEEWYAEREASMDEIEKLEAMREHDMVIESFGAMNELGLIGGVVEVSGRVIAFTLGERERERDILYTRLEKGDGNYKGIYAYINQMFAQNNSEGINWINREEDMGMPGLRKSKESYFPNHMVKKYMLDFSNMK